MILTFGHFFGFVIVQRARNIIFMMILYVITFLTPISSSSWPTNKENKLKAVGERLNESVGGFLVYIVQMDEN